MSKNIKTLAVTDTIIDAFTSKCTKTYAADSDCETFVDENLVKTAVKATDQAAFKAVCEVTQPPSGG
jgi:hypothetical protein